MAGVLYRLGRVCANRALVVVAVWVGLVLGVQLVVRSAGAETSNDLRLPGTESQRATDLRLGNVLSKSPTESSAVIGLLAAMVILALTFGSLVAMGMPIATAVLAWPPRSASSACSATSSRSPPSGRPWPP